MITFALGAIVQVTLTIDKFNGGSESPTWESDNIASQRLMLLGWTLLRSPGSMIPVTFLQVIVSVALWSSVGAGSGALWGWLRRGGTSQPGF